MDASFMPSLEHLACEKIVMSLLDDSDLHWRSLKDYDSIKSKITKKISKLIPCDLFQRKLKNVIAPLLYEVRNWIEFCEKHWVGFEGTVFRIETTVLQSRVRYGTIDREKFLNILIKNDDISPLTRFILACVYCMFEDVADLWTSLLKIEKVFLRRQNFTNSEAPHVIKHFIEWLENDGDKTWESFVAWTLETSVWKSNVYIMRRVLQTLSPAEKSQYLLKALTGVQVSSEMVRFGLPIMSLNDREVFFRESSLEVFKCMLYWPLRGVFIDLSSKLWPYVTEDTFCRVLEMILSKIRNEYFDYLDLIVILKNFWAQSPDSYKKIVENDSYMFGSINFVLEYNFAQPFQKDRFLHTF